jgi:hypothetical protein
MNQSSLIVEYTWPSFIRNSTPALQDNKTRGAWFHTHHTPCIAAAHVTKGRGTHPCH